MLPECPAASSTAATASGPSRPAPAWTRNSDAALLIQRGPLWAWLNHALIGRGGQHACGDRERWRYELGVIAGAIKPFVVQGGELTKRHQAQVSAPQSPLDRRDACAPTFIPGSRATTTRLPLDTAYSCCY